MFDTDHLVTFAALVVGGGLVAYTAILERRPRQTLDPRLLPTTPIMFVGALIAVLALVHLMTLLGYSTGRNF
jgi:hypothetical protein